MIDFGLWAECENAASIRQFKAHFDDWQHTLLTGRTITFETGVEEDSGVWSLGVGSSQICEKGRGIESLRDALEVTEVGILLYHRLVAAPDFLFAHVGWNAEGTTSKDLFEVVETLHDGKPSLNVECVINDQLYQQLGTPVNFRQFREGYWWCGYDGEIYRPLFSADQKDLHNLSKRLLPAIYVRKFVRRPCTE